MLDRSVWGHGAHWTPVADEGGMVLVQVSGEPIRLGPGPDIYTGTPGSDVIYGEGGNDSIHASRGNDKVKGGDGNDSLSGDPGDDTLIGGQGDDSLSGDSGRDILYGGYGKDYYDMQGGLGHDVALYRDLIESTPGDRHDTIFNFDQGGDTVDLSEIDANPSTPENDRFRWIDGDAFSDKPGQLRFVPDDDGGLLQADVNGDGVADFEVYFLNFTPLDLTAGDFKL